MSVTLKDVAREAGFNLSTVSRSLSGSYGVHQQTRKRVLEVAERLHYRPNRIARGLVTGRSHTLGLIVSDVRNPFFAEVARGAEDAARAHGCDLVLCNSDLDQAKQMCYIRSLAEKRVDGVLMNSVAALRKTQQEAASGCLSRNHRGRCQIPSVRSLRVPRFGPKRSPVRPQHVPSQMEPQR
jgi:LacI family transcriptional regulator